MAANAISPLSDNHGSSAAVPTPAPTAFSAARRETLVIVYFLAGPHPRSQMPRVRRALRACARWHGRRRFFLSRGAPPPLADASRAPRASRLRPLAWPQALFPFSRSPTPARRCLACAARFALAPAGMAAGAFYFLAVTGPRLRDSTPLRSVRRASL